MELIFRSLQAVMNIFIVYLEIYLFTLHFEIRKHGDF